MNEMKPEDVMKALECCADCGCDGCPYVPPRDCHKGTMGCSEELIKDAIALLREKDAKLAMCVEVIKRQDRELADNDSKIKALRWTNKHLMKTEKEKRRELWKRCKTDTINEFARRLKKTKFAEGGIGCDCVYVGRINEIAKGMKEELE